MASAADNEPSLRQTLPHPVDAKVITITVVTAVVLTGSYYFGHYAKSQDWIAALLQWFGIDDAQSQLKEIFGRRRSNPRARLWQLHYWSAAHTILYFVIPVLVIKLGFREKLSDYGLKLGGWYKRLWVYIGAYLVVLPCMLAVRGTPAFQKAYPFYKHAYLSWGDFLGWELAYLLQFFALEFFFRGFLVHGLKHRFGYYAVCFMTVPYCMIHFGKPLPETLGAIIAGIFLGTLSLWTRSIWLGVLIHASVAVSMDLAAMHYRGEIGLLLNT